MVPWKSNSCIMPLSYCGTSLYPGDILVELSEGSIIYRDSLLRDCSPSTLVAAAVSCQRRHPMGRGGVRDNPRGDHGDVLVRSVSAHRQPLWLDLAGLPSIVRLQSLGGFVCCS